MTLDGFAQSLAGSAAHDGAVYLLGNVPGLPPIVQTFHILAIAAIMGSVVMVDLRVLGMALRSQHPGELLTRLMPWTWWALPVLALSGSMFVLARPNRYFANPVFGLKFGLLVPALLGALALQLLSRGHPELWDRPSGRRTLMKLIAAASLLSWVGVVLAGRWIAYADYLFPPPE
jgi:hypothetical protein